MSSIEPGLTNATPRPLLAPSFRVFGLPPGVLVTSFFAALFCTFFFFASCAGDPGPKENAVIFGSVFVFCLVIYLGPALWRAARTTVALDEGGLRCSISGFSTYYPFALLGPASVTTEAFAIPSLVLSDRTGRPLLKVPLLKGAVVELGKQFVEAYEQRRAELPEEPPRALMHLARNGRTMADWLDGLEKLALTVGQAGYRAQGVDRAELEALVQDMRQEHTYRAAAAYTLLATKQPSARALVEPVVRESAPPTLLLLVRASSVGKELVSDALMESVRDYVDAEDWGVVMAKA